VFGRFFLIGLVPGDAVMAYLEQRDGDIPLSMIFLNFTRLRVLFLGQVCYLVNFVGYILKVEAVSLTMYPMKFTRSHTCSKLTSAIV
jgi:hypothetical protein